MSEVSDTLRAARKLIEKPENWCKGGLARTRHGNQTHPVKPDAFARCVVGVLKCGATDDASFVAGFKALRRALPGGFLHIADFNDAPDTTHPMVLDLFDRAIEMEGGMSEFRDQLETDIEDTKSLWRRVFGDRPAQHEQEGAGVDDNSRALVSDALLFGAGYGVLCVTDGSLSLKQLRAEDVLDPVPALEAKNARLREALEQCAEYFDDHQEVDTSDGEPVANKEMRLMGVVKTVLGEK